MAIPIITDWKTYFTDENEGLGSSYERVIINNLLEKVCNEFDIDRVLEVPLFGFTGLSGINSMNLAKNGKEVTLVDNSSERLVLIDRVWQECRLEADLRYSKDFESFPFAENQFDMSWNFSALWFAKDLKLLLTEMDRVTRKVILIMVPNRKGIGYMMQLIGGNKEQKKMINLRWIKYSFFSVILNDLGWTLKERGYIDCPPWPDIGMKKEKLAKKLGLGFFIDRHVEQQQQHSIMNFYRGVDEGFPERMMKYSRLEKKLPDFLKQFWAHHHYYLYVKNY